MRRIRGVIAAVMAVLLCAGQAVAVPKSNWDDLNSQVVKFYMQGDYIRATEIAVEALSVAKTLDMSSAPKRWHSSATRRS